MAYQQVRDILAHVRATQEHVLRYCEAHRHAADDDMIRGMLERVERHNNAMEACLAEYESGAAAAVLDTWIQYPGLERLDRTVGELATAGDEPAADVLERVLAAERMLLDVYQNVADQAHGRGVQEFFQNLLFMEAQTGRAIGRDVTDIRDMRSI